MIGLLKSVINRCSFYTTFAEATGRVQYHRIGQIFNYLSYSYVVCLTFPDRVKMPPVFAKVRHLLVDICSINV